MIGKTISHYRIIEKLGEGGMGVVYTAEDLKLGRVVALKFLPPEWTRDAAARARFFHEAQAAAALNHPNICTIFEIDEADRQIFIAMERVEGESLRDVIARAPMKIGEVLDVSVRIAEGLAAAHAEGIVHRDIKPGNVMLTSGVRPKIMDFGLAKSVGQTKLTRVGTTTGTVAYMSPEQSRGEDVDHRTDIWSFGAMLYEMLTGRRPFRGDRDQAVIHSILNDEPDPITGLRTGVPIELERIVRKAMAKRADERYQHVDDLIADLRSLKRGLDSGTATVSVPAGAPATKRAGVAAVWRWAIVAAAVVVALTMVWRVTRRGAPPADLDPGKVVVAVLENRTGDASLDPIGQMAAD
jgi:serine/threonine protein kinase